MATQLAGGDATRACDNSRSLRQSGYIPSKEVVSTLEHERGVEPAALLKSDRLQNAALRPIIRAGQGCVSKRSIRLC